MPQMDMAVMAEGLKLCESSLQDALAALQELQDSGEMDYTQEIATLEEVLVKIQEDMAAAGAESESESVTTE